MKLQNAPRRSSWSGVVLHSAVSRSPRPPAPMSVQLYGQVSRALMFADDGTQSKWFHVDNEASGTRFGATGTGR